jgi:hypothetical protein
VPGSQAPQPPSAATETPSAAPEVTAIIGDLHWLVHQGHVIEFASGALETAKKPLPRPPRPALASPSSEAATSDVPPQNTEGENQPQAVEVSAATEAVVTEDAPPVESSDVPAAAGEAP